MPLCISTSHDSIPLSRKYALVCTETWVHGPISILRKDIIQTKKKKIRMKERRTPRNKEEADGKEKDTG